MKVLYDPKCEELARFFLPVAETEDNIQALAGAIQEVIEDWLQSEGAE